MPTYTFPKVERRASKNVKCDACGKRMKRSTTFFQTLSPFNKTPDGELKTREQIHVELQAKEELWREDREWCAPCFEATHLYAKDLAAGDVLESEIGDIQVTAVAIEKGEPGYGDAVRVNADAADPITFRAYDRIVIRPRPA